jgi:hypothetical protein
MPEVDVFTPTPFTRITTVIAKIIITLVTTLY